jgi:hypothetical protein
MNYGGIPSPSPPPRPKAAFRMRRGGGQVQCRPAVRVGRVDPGRNTESLP